MNKAITKITVLTAGYLGLGYLLKEYDPLHYYYFASKLRYLNESMRNVHQHVRKRELFANAHGEVVELNAGTGNTLPLLPLTVSRYYANETNPASIPKIKAATREYSCPISHIEHCTSLELLRAMGSNTMDTVILNGTLRYEKPSQNQRLFNEIHRVLRPGGTVLFSEDVMHGTHQIAPFQTIRRYIRNVFTGEYQSDFVPPLLRAFDCAYIEDWSRPPLGFHKSHRQTTKCVLDYHQRHSYEENLGQYLRNIPKWNFSFLHRPIYGGWAVKKTTARGDEVLLSGRVSVDKLNQFTQFLKPAKDTDLQAKRELRAQNDGYQYDTKLVQSMRASIERQQKKKPTQPKSTYPDMQPIPVALSTLWQ